MDEITALWIETLKKNGSAFLRVEGKSMEPTIKVGERLKIVSIRPEEVNIGDVVVFSPSPLPFILFPSPSRGEGQVEGGRGSLCDEEEHVPYDGRSPGTGEGIEFIVHRVVDKFKFQDKLYFVHQGDKAGPLGMSIFAEDQLIGKVGNHECTRIETRIHTNILLRKFFIYFFIFKQLLKKTLQIQTDRGTDANR